MKQLHDLGLFQKLPIYLGSKLTMAKINLSYQFRYMIRAMEKKQLDFAFNDQNDKVSKLLYDFRKPYFFYNWVITNDKEIGGESEGNAYYNNDHVLVRGSLVEERSDLLQQRMYYGIVSQYFTKLNVVDYNGIRIKLKTDGNLYKVIMRVASIANNDHHIYGFVVDTSKEWQTVELPFQNFLSEGTSPLEKAKNLDELGELTLKGIGIVIENEQSTDFEFAVEKIEVIYNPEFNALTRFYQRPFFFYSQDSYEGIKVLDTGKEKLAIQISKLQENKKSVNDLFTEEQPEQPYRAKDIPLEKEVKPVSILKERLAKKVNK